MLGDLLFVWGIKLWLLVLASNEWVREAKEIGERAFVYVDGRTTQDGENLEEVDMEMGNEEKERCGRQNSVIKCVREGTEAREAKGKERRVKIKEKEKRGRGSDGRNDSTEPPGNRKGTGREGASHSEPRLS